MSLSDLRVEYAGQPLVEADVPTDPFVFLQRWLDQAVEAELPLANAMTLATCGRDGQPSARVVLLKELDSSGLVFFTHYESRKARELASNPRTTGLLWWAELQRQVRVEGGAQQIPAEASDSYFASRPRESNLSALATPQSQVVASREQLELAVASTETMWNDKPLVRPETWGGYRIVPRVFEFFQGRENRLHDRLRYRLRDGTWNLDRLAP